MSQARRIVIPTSTQQMQGITFSICKLDETVKGVVQVQDEDRSTIKNWSYNPEMHVLNVTGKHNILYLIIEK